MNINNNTFEKFRFTVSKYGILMAIFIAMVFEILRFFNIFPPSQLIVVTTFILVAILSLMYILIQKSNIKLIYIQWISLLSVITYIIFQTALVDYHKFLPIWIDFSIIIAFLIMDKKYALGLSFYSLVGIIFIYNLGVYKLDFFSFFTLLFSIVSFSILGYVISLQLNKYEEDNKRQKEKLKQLVLLDELTQIFNRRAFFEIATKLLKQANRENKKISVLMLDIDFFKKINDTYGHEAGDEVLKKVTCIIQKTIRENDIFARLGGEEFVILLYDVDIFDTKNIASKILEAIRKHKIIYKSNKIKITMSIGIYCIDTLNTNDNIKEFLLKSDQALYEAKNTGKDKYVFYKEEK